MEVWTWLVSLFLGSLDSVYYLDCSSSKCLYVVKYINIIFVIVSASDQWDCQLRSGLCNSRN